MISGKTTLVAHVGYPTFAFKSPMIYNPWFEKNGIDAVVVPMGVQAPDYPDFFRSIFSLTNIRGALVTMPHKVTTMGLVDEISPTATVAGAANAVLRRDDGTLVGFGSEALDAGPLRTLRPGQRVTISMLGDVVVTITHPGFSPPGGDEAG